MKKIMFLLTVLLLSQACKKDDPCEYGSESILAPPQFVSIELLDSDGNNLIDNGIYLESDITVTVNGKEDSNIIKQTSNSGEERRVILIRPFGENTTQIASIKLNENIIDTLSLNVTVDKDKCNRLEYTFNSAIYNDQSQQLDFSDAYSKRYPTITIIKTNPCPPLEGKQYLSPVQHYILVELVDSQGNNLIENGTYAASEITVSVNGGDEYPGVSEDEKLITILPFGENTTQIAVIKLNENTIDTLELDVTVEKNQCNAVRYLFNSATYNGQPQQLDFSTESEDYPRIRVVRE